MLPAIVIVSRFLSVSIHIRYPNLLIRILLREQRLIILFPFDTNWPFLWTKRSPLQRTKRYDIPAKLRTYYLHTQHLIYNCNISIYFYGVTSSWRLTRRYPRLLLSSTSGCPWTTWYGAATGAACPRNSHGVAHKRSLPQSIAPIPDLRSNLSVSAPGFTGIHTLPHKESVSYLLGGRLPSRFRGLTLAFF